MQKQEASCWAGLPLSLPFVIMVKQVLAKWKKRSEPSPAGGFLLLWGVEEGHVLHSVAAVSCKVRLYFPYAETVSRKEEMET